MNTDEKNTIIATDDMAQYDRHAKKILSNKVYLSHILVHSVDEFRDMNPDDVVGCIDGDIYVGSVPVDSGMTNVAMPNKPSTIRQLNTVDAEIGEGMVVYDILFYAHTKNGRARIIINLEAQKNEPSEYGILNRATFYACRMISSQKSRDFADSNYDDIQQIYSIWICMNMEQDVMTRYHIAKEDIISSYSWKGRSDLLNIAMIGLSETQPEQSTRSKLHRFLGTLFSTEKTRAERCEILEKEYNIKMTTNMKEEITDMCNLSVGVLERGIRQGEARGISIGEARGISIGESRGKSQGERNVISAFYNNGFSIEQIANVTKKSVQEVQELVSDETAR